MTPEVPRAPHRLGLLALELRRGGGQGHAHIGAGVAVRHGEDVEVVDGLLLPGDAGGAVEHHLLEKRRGDLIVHG